MWFGHGYESVLIDAGLVVALEVDPSGPHLLQDLEVSPVEGALEVPPPPPPPQSAYLTEFNSLLRRLLQVGGVEKTLASSYPASQFSGTFDAGDSSSSGSSSEDTFECIINVRNCPLFHLPWLTKNAKMDILTHIAVCASGEIDKIIVGISPFFESAL